MVILDIPVKFLGNAVHIFSCVPQMKAEILSILAIHPFSRACNLVAPLTCCVNFTGRVQGPWASSVGHSSAFWGGSHPYSRLTGACKPC